MPFCRPLSGAGRIVATAASPVCSSSMTKSVMTGTTFSRVSYDIPGQLQRFARARAFRDAEDRAANEIAENIQTRLASYFVAGT